MHVALQQSPGFWHEAPDARHADGTHLDPVHVLLQQSLATAHPCPAARQTLAAHRPPWQDWLQQSVYEEQTPPPDRQGPGGVGVLWPASTPESTGAPDSWGALESRGTSESTGRLESIEGPESCPVLPATGPLTVPQPEKSPTTRATTTRTLADTASPGVRIGEVTSIRHDTTAGEHPAEGRIVAVP